MLDGESEVNQKNGAFERQAAAVADRLLTVREVAERLGVSPRQIWKLRASGRLCTPVRLSRSVRWRASDIAKFIDLGCDMARFEAGKRGAKL
jgi:predicted DNA-binding transcriptional regulator AlpA